MENKFDTNIGKIYCTYNEETDEFEKMRVRKIKNEKITVSYLDQYNHMDIKNTFTYSIDKFKKVIEKCVLLKSEGIVSLSNVVSSSNGSTIIPDVIAIFFPNNPVTKVPEFNQPYIVARQGIENLYASMANVNVVGMAVSIDTLPAGWALSDFMVNEKVNSSYMTHVYKTDTAQELSILLNNDESKRTFKSLYDHAVDHLPIELHNNGKYKRHENDCVNGYCGCLKRFLTECDFMGELYNKIGIVKIDTPLESNVQLTDDDKILVSTLCGGIRINKAVPVKFDYDVNMDIIKMRYLLINDSNDILWIVPYTVSDDEFDANYVYKLTEESTIKLQDRLKKVVKAYDKSTNIKSGSPVEMIDIPNVK